VAQVQGDRGIEDTDLDRAIAILYKNPMYRPPYQFFVNLTQLGVHLGLKNVRLECQAAAARCSLSLSALAQARRTMIQGSDDDHLLLHPHRSWQERSATNVLGKLHDNLRRECPDGLQPPFLQRQCRAHLQSKIPYFNFHALIKARIATVLRRIQIEDDQIIDSMATNTLDTIILATLHLNCTAMQAFLRMSQNGFSIGAVGDASSPCPLCEAPSAARLSHLLNCGALWLFLDEECPGLAWDFAHANRWQFLFGTLVSDSFGAALLCLAWDCIHAGIQAGRFGRVGLAGCVSRLQALCNRSGTTGQFARVLHHPAIPAVQ
jgi:hypothetical protein